MLMAAMVASLALAAGPEKALKPVDAGLYAPFCIVPVAELRQERLAESFRAVALDLPRVWAVQRSGDVCLFEIDTNKRYQFLHSGAVIATEAEGDDVVLAGRNLFLPRNGELHRLDISKNNTLTPSGVFGAPGKWDTRAIAERGTDAFVIDAKRIVSFTGMGVGQTPNASSTFDGSEIWINADAAGGFLYASCAWPEDGSKGMVVFEIGPDCGLTRRGVLKTPYIPLGVHALQDGRVALLSDTRERRMDLVSVANPDAPTVQEHYAIPVSRCSVLTKFEGIDVLVAGRDCLLFEKDGVTRMTYPFDTGLMLDGSSYFGDAEGIFCAIPTDDTILITAFDEPIFRK